MFARFIIRWIAQNVFGIVSNDDIGRNQVYCSFISIRGELFRKYPKIRDYSSLALDFYLHRIVSRSRK